MADLTPDLIIKKQAYENKTYKLSNNKIEGLIDGLEALRQTIYKVLSTDQYEYPIYSFDYGISWKELIGQERSYVRAEMKRMIQEALLLDNRISDVDGFEFSFVGDTCKCNFNVISIYGNLEIETEVLM